MIVFINALTGTEMLVADDRKEEYLAAGHKLAAGTIEKAKKAEPVTEVPKKETSYRPAGKKSAQQRKK